MNDISQKIQTIMEKYIKNVVIYTVSILLIIFSCYLMLRGCGDWNADFMQRDYLAIKVILVLIGGFFLLLFLLIAWKWINNCSNTKRIILSVIFMGITLMGQILFTVALQSSLRYDALWIFDQAIHILDTGKISSEFNQGYFTWYTNNYPITIWTYYCLKLAKSLGIAREHYMLYIDFVNIIAIDMSIFIGSRLIGRVKKELATYLLFLSMICPLMYLCAPFYYTGSMVLPFFMGIIFSACKAHESKIITGRIMWTVLCALLFAFGYRIRPVAIIVIVALGIIFLTFKEKEKLKKYSLCIGIFLLLSVIFISLVNRNISNYIDFDYEDSEFPAIHWVMMAMNQSRDGTFNKRDEVYTASFATKEEKKEADFLLLKERLIQGSPLDMTGFLLRKLSVCWVDGTDNLFPEDSQCAHYNKLYDYSIGEKSGLTLVYAQVFRTLQFLLVFFIASWTLLFYIKNKKISGQLLLLELILLGGMIFHLIWEASTLYSISFSVILLCLNGAGVWQMEKVITPSWQRGIVSVGGLGIAATLILLYIGKKELVETPIFEDNYSARQSVIEDEWLGTVDEGEEWTQSFIPERAFNKVSIRVFNPLGKENESSYWWSIYNKSGTVAYEGIQDGSEFEDEGEWAVTFDTIIPDNSQLWYLTVKAVYAQGDNALGYRTYSTKNHDSYGAGALYINGVEQTNVDLVFEVIEEKVTTYYSIRAYIIIGIFLLGIQVGILIVYWKWSKKNSICL